MGCQGLGRSPHDGINYRDKLKDSSTQMEICFAIFANVLELDDQGEQVNEKYAERRAATWLYRYCVGDFPPRGRPSVPGVPVLLTLGSSALTGARPRMALGASTGSTILPMSVLCQNHAAALPACAQPPPASRQPAPPCQLRRTGLHSRRCMLLGPWGPMQRR